MEGITQNIVRECITQLGKIPLGFSFDSFRRLLTRFDLSVSKHIIKHKKGNGSSQFDTKAKMHRKSLNSPVLLSLIPNLEALNM